MQTDATLLTNNSQHCWIFQVASVCTPCCMLLDVVACFCAKFETGQTFQPTTSYISFVATLLGPRTLNTHGLQRLIGCILPAMHCRSQHCWELLRPFARSLKDKASIVNPVSKLYSLAYKVQQTFFVPAKKRRELGEQHETRLLLKNYYSCSKEKK